MHRLLCDRYPCQQTIIQAYVLEVVRDHLLRRQTIGMDASCRNLIRLMTVTAGYAEIRAIAGQRLEMWLQNPKVCLGWCDHNGPC